MHAHAPALQYSPSAHLLPQAPQVLGSGARFDSQPFAPRPSQSANPVLQLVTVHTDAVQLRPLPHSSLVEQAPSRSTLPNAEQMPSPAADASAHV